MLWVIVNAMYGRYWYFVGRDPLHLTGYIFLHGCSMKEKVPVKELLTIDQPLGEKNLEKCLSWVPFTWIDRLRFWSTCLASCIWNGNWISKPWIMTVRLSTYYCLLRNSKTKLSISSRNAWSCRQFIQLRLLPFAGEAWHVQELIELCPQRFL